MDLLLEYVEIISELDSIQETGLNNKKQVKRNNKLADRLRTIASEIDNKYPEMKLSFHKLLFHEKATVRSWVAHHILEVMNYDDEVRRDALKEIIFISTHDESIHGLGNSMWLKQWFENHPGDKKLL